MMLSPAMIKWWYVRLGGAPINERWRLRSQPAKKSLLLGWASCAFKMVRFRKVGRIGMFWASTNRLASFHYQSELLYFAALCRGKASSIHVVGGDIAGLHQPI